MDIGTPHGPISYEEMEDCMIATDFYKHYHTKNFIYISPDCDATQCDARILQNNKNYELKIVINRENQDLPVTKMCRNYGNDIGAYICKYLEPQGWEYVEGNSPWEL